MNGVTNLSLAARNRCGDIAFIDLKAQQKRIRDRIEARLSAVLDHGRYIAGPEIDELEALLAEKTGVRGVVSCGSGTDALLIPMLARGLVTGDAVFVPSFTYNATVNAILLTGAAPVFVDIDPETFNMCPRALQRAIDHVRAQGRLRPRAVVPVDLFGAPADYEAITTIAAREELFLLADGAQSYGGRLNGTPVGNLAPVTAVSFFPGKALGAYGEAGAIFTRDPVDIEEFQSIRWHGTDADRKESIRVGLNGRLDSFQAAVLLEKLAIFDDELAARHHIAARYKQRLSGIVQCQGMIDGAESGYGYFSVLTENRDAVVYHLKTLGVPTAIYYKTPLHHMGAFKAYAGLGGPEGTLEVTERVAAQIFALPMHPNLSDMQVEYITDAVELAVARAQERDGDPAAVAL